MKRRKSLVLATCAVFAVVIGALSISRALLVPKPVVIAIGGFPQIGQGDAKIEIVVFEDFLCHTCRYFSMEVFPAIQSTYVETGAAKYVMVPLAFSEHSFELSNAALAVFSQVPQSFFPFVQELFALYSDTKKIELKDLFELASKIEGIDLVAFEASVKGGEFDDALNRNLEIAKRAMKKNLRTPAVFINGYPTPGISFESISTQIESILENKES